MRDELIIAEVCRQYAWTYQEYMTQPEWLIHAVTQKLIIDATRDNAARKARAALQ